MEKRNLFDLAVKSAKLNVPRGRTAYIYHDTYEAHDGRPIVFYGWTEYPQRNKVSEDNIICAVEGEREGLTQ